MPKTPKTDAAILDISSDDSSCSIYLHSQEGNVIYGDVVSADFARQLEEENTAMRQAISFAAESIDGLDLHLEGNHGIFILAALEKLQPFLK